MLFILANSCISFPGLLPSPLFSDHNSNVRHIESAKKQIGALNELSKTIKSVGADALKFAEADFSKNIKLPSVQIVDSEKSVADMEKIDEEPWKFLFFELRWRIMRSCRAH